MTAFGRFLGSACVLACFCAGCRSDPTQTPPPPPLPTTPTVPSPTPEPGSDNALSAPIPKVPEASSAAGGEEVLRATEDAVPEASDVKDDKEPSRSAKNAGTSLYDMVKRGEATLPGSQGAPQEPAAAKPAPAQPTTESPGPTATPAPVSAKPAASRGKVTVPSTAHVKVEIPPGLQAAFDQDPRMQPWANKVIDVIDTCYTKERSSSPNAAGVISVRITMHSESRPDADVKSLPPALSGVVACATGGLMRTKMPLFTGNEGEVHTLNIRFTP